MMRTYLCCLLSVAMMGVTAGSAHSVVLDQIDDFEDGTVENWMVNLLGLGSHPAPPANVPDGGPMGAGDNYLRLTAVGGNGAGNRLTVINPAQWSGNYVGAGVTGIVMNVNNLGTTELSLRLLFEKVGGTGPTDIAASTNAVDIAPGSGWTTAIFPVGPAALTALLGSTNNALTDATVIRLYHSPTVTFPGPPLQAILGVDNIKAVPEPATAVGALMGLALFARRRRASRASS